jgi:hypothetical protein
MNEKSTSTSSKTSTICSGGGVNIVCYNLEVVDATSNFFTPYKLHLLTNMKLFTAFLLASTAAAFAPATPLSFAATRRGASASSMQMVADDAKVCLVTGSSRGLGKAIALELGKAGQKVVVNFVSDGSKESADATVEEIKALGGDAIAVQADSKLVRLECLCVVALKYIYLTYMCISILRRKAPNLRPSMPCSRRLSVSTEHAMFSSTMQELPRIPWWHE